MLSVLRLDLWSDILPKPFSRHQKRVRTRSWRRGWKTNKRSAKSLKCGFVVLNTFSVIVSCCRCREGNKLSEHPARVKTRRRTIVMEMTWWWYVPAVAFALWICVSHHVSYWRSTSEQILTQTLLVFFVFPFGIVKSSRTEKSWNCMGGVEVCRLVLRLSYSVQTPAGSWTWPQATCRKSALDQCFELLPRPDRVLRMSSQSRPSSRRTTLTQTSAKRRRRRRRNRSVHQGNDTGIQCSSCEQLHCLLSVIYFSSCSICSGALSDRSSSIADGVWASGGQCPGSECFGGRFLHFPGWNVLQTSHAGERLWHQGTLLTNGWNVPQLHGTIIQFVLK